MQTFLPYPSFAQSASVLDWQRLGKQRVEAKQILLALSDPHAGWQRHPAVGMWRGYVPALAAYGAIICREWRRRGYNDSLLPYFEAFDAGEDFSVPAWLGDEAFHSSHRSNLLRKDAAHYGQFGWREAPTLPYVWPKGA